MLLKHLPVLIVFLFAILGCASTETVESTKVAPSEIYQSYIIEANKDRTSVTATFRVGGATGSTVDLDAPGKILHNGKQMTETAPGFMKGTDYHASANNFVPNHKFAYTDATGKTWQNEVSLYALEMTGKNLTISKTNGGVITLSRAVGEDETVDLTLSSEANPPATNSNANNKLPEKDYSITLPPNFDTARTNIKVEPSLLKNFVNGKAQISLTVRKTTTLQQTAKGGSINFSYDSQKISANVIN